MKTILLTPISVLIVLAIAQARHHAEQKDESDLSNDYDEDHLQKRREQGTEQLRRRRRRWQMNYGYDYPPPPYYQQQDNTQRYQSRQDNMLPEILRLLEEISNYIKRPAPPPQPIYVPYSVPYPVPQYCQCRRPSNNGPSRLNITSRWPEMEDPRQNWGYEVRREQEERLGEEDYVDDSVRPIAFAPAKRPSQSQSRVPSEVNRGSFQAGASLTTSRPRILASGRQTTAAPTITPGVCDAAVLSCCKPSDNNQDQAQCFTNFGCVTTYRNGEACEPKNIASVLDLYSSTYTRP